MFIWGALRGIETGVSAEPELHYIGAMFNDLGLTRRYRTENQRFEIDGADEARRFLLEHGLATEKADDVWNAIALHTTPEVPLHMSPVVALVTRGVELDVMGIGYDSLSDEQRSQVVSAHPRPDFKNQILQAFHDGLRHRPDTTFGNVKADVLDHFDPDFRPGNFVEVVQNSAWSE